MAIAHQYLGKMILIFSSTTTSKQENKKRVCRVWQTRYKSINQKASTLPLHELKHESFYSIVQSEDLTFATRIERIIYSFSNWKQLSGFIPCTITSINQPEFKSINILYRNLKSFFTLRAQRLKLILLDYTGQLSQSSSLRSGYFIITGKLKETVTIIQLDAARSKERSEKKR